MTDVIASHIAPPAAAMGRQNRDATATLAFQSGGVAGECRAGTLPLLYEMSRSIGESADLTQAIVILLRMMERHMNVVRGRVSLYDRNSGSIYLHESLGLTEEEEERGISGFGDGVTDRVVETGKAVVIPRIGDAPEFLRRTRGFGNQERGLSFLCVPIMRGKRVLGTISAERIYDNDESLDLDVNLIGIIAAIMAQTVELYLLENVDRIALIDENRRLHSALRERFHPANFVGNSKGMRQVYGLIQKVARTHTAVLILGESGVGKALVAQAIHYSGYAPDGPLVQVDCAALPENGVESELFGHEKGPLTGAADARKGRLEEADGGTIFLDEVGELPLSMQARILRVLQEKTFERVGGNRPVKVDIRIVAATNRNLADMVRQGTFREDLYQRLNVCPIAIPPLRDRGSDIIALADHFVERYAAEKHKDVRRISTPALNMLMSYHWPGNVRELESVIQRATSLAEDGVIHGYNLPPSLQTPVLSGTVARGGLDAKLNAIEYETIIDALKTHGGNTTEAASELGLTRRILGLRMTKYGISYKNYRLGGTRPE